MIPHHCFESAHINEKELRGATQNVVPRSYIFVLCPFRYVLQIEIGEGAWKGQEFKAKQGQRYEALAKEMRLEMATAIVAEADSVGEKGAAARLWDSMKNLWFTGDEEESRVAINARGSTDAADEEGGVQVDEQAVRAARLRDVEANISDHQVDLALARKREHGMGSEQAFSSTARSSPTMLGSFKGWGSSRRKDIEVHFPRISKVRSWADRKINYFPLVLLSK